MRPLAATPPSLRANRATRKLVQGIDLHALLALKALSSENLLPRSAKISMIAARLRSEIPLGR